MAQNVEDEPPPKHPRYEPCAVSREKLRRTMQIVRDEEGQETSARLFECFFINIAKGSGHALSLQRFKDRYPDNSRDRCNDCGLVIEEHHSAVVDIAPTSIAETPISISGLKTNFGLEPMIPQPANPDWVGGKMFDRSELLETIQMAIGKVEKIRSLSLVRASKSREW